MLSYCLKCKKKTGSKKFKCYKKNGKLLNLSKCVVCGSKKLRFIKELEAIGL